MSRTEKIDRVREWLRWVMGDGGDQLLEEILEGSTMSDLDDDGSLDALCRLMEHSTTRREDLKLIMDFQRHQMAEYDRESDRMMGILNSCGVTDLKHPDLFSKADILARVAHSLRLDNPTKTEMVGKLACVKAEAVKAPLKKYLLSKRADRNHDGSLKSLKALSKTETAHKIQAAAESSTPSEAKTEAQKAEFIMEKGNEYSQLIDRHTSILEQQHGYRPEISPETLLALKAELDRIRNEELKPLKQSLDAFKGLPPDFQLAKAKLAEAQVKFDKLNSQMMESIADLQI